MHLWCVEADHQAVHHLWVGMKPWRASSPHVPDDQLHRRTPTPPRFLDDDLADLAAYADPDCRDCHGSGQLHRMPCDACMVGVWL